MSYNFDADAAKRIVQSVKFTEGQNRNPQPRQKPLGNVVSGERWAKITARSGSKYSWQAVSMDENGVWQNITGITAAHSDTNFAYELHYKSQYVLNNSIVLLRTCGQPFYVFEYLPCSRRGTLAGLLSAGSSVNCTMSMDSGGNQTMTVFNPFNGSIDNNSFVMCHWAKGRWEVGSTDCQDGDE